MNNMNWIFCNVCFISKQPGLKFFCTTCCHVICKNCIRTNCPVCGKNLRAMEINSSLPQKVQWYFEDVPTLICRLRKTIKFQWEHRSRYERNKHDLLSKYVEKSDEHKKLKRGITILKDEIRKENARILKLQNYIVKWQRILMDRRVKQGCLRSQSIDYIDDARMQTIADIAPLGRDMFSLNLSRPSDILNSINTTKDTGYESID